MRARIVSVERKVAVCERCRLALSPAVRLRGLLGRRRLGPGEGILLRPARSIHTALMRFAIDVVFLDRDGYVVDVRPRLGAWRVATSGGSHSVLELAAGEAERREIQVGERLAIVPEFDLNE